MKVWGTGFSSPFAFKTKRGVSYLENEEKIVSDETVLDNISEESKTETAEKAEDKKDFRHEIIEWMEVVVSALVAVVLVFTFFVRIATIQGPSMENTLHNGEKVLISKVAYTPKQGDVVVVSRNYNAVDPSKIKWPADPNNSEPIIKRIIAVEGQKVDIDFDKGIVYVDGKALDEPYTKTPTNVKADVQFPLIVPEGCVFVLGDNRNNSTDSRFSQLGNEGNGMVKEEYIIGCVYLRIFPFDKFGGID